MSLTIGCEQSNGAVFPLWVYCVCVHHVCAFLHVVYLWHLCRLVLQQLPLEAVVWADKGANSLDSRQTLIPVVVGDGHQVGHHHSGAAGHTCEAAAKQRTQRGHCQKATSRLNTLFISDKRSITEEVLKRFFFSRVLFGLTPTSERDKIHHSGDIHGWSWCTL